MLIIRRSKLYYTASGSITLVGGRPVHRLRDFSQPVCLSARCFHTSRVLILLTQNPRVHRTYKQHFELWNIVVVFCSQMFPFVWRGPRVTFRANIMFILVSAFTCWLLDMSQSNIYIYIYIYIYIQGVSRL